MAEVVYTDAEEITAPIERLFAFRLDFTTLPSYNPNVSNIRQTVGDGPGAGAEYLFDLTLPGAPEPLETPLRVLEAVEPERIVIEVGPGYMAREVCTFSRTSDGSRCEFATTLTFPGEIPDEAARAVEQQGSEQVRLELDLMKKILEG